MIQVNNGKCGYEIQQKNNEYQLFCFDLTINRGAKLPLGTVALVYPTELEALIEGEKWMKIHAQSSTEEVKRLLCRVPTRKHRPSWPNTTLFGVGVSI